MLQKLLRWRNIWAPRVAFLLYSSAMEHANDFVWEASVSSSLASRRRENSGRRRQAFVITAHHHECGCWLYFGLEKWKVKTGWKFKAPAAAWLDGPRCDSLCWCAHICTNERLFARERCVLESWSVWCPTYKAPVEGGKNPTSLSYYFRCRRRTALRAALHLDTRFFFYSDVYSVCARSRKMDRRALTELVERRERAAADVCRMWRRERFTKTRNVFVPLCFIFSSAVF